MTTISDVATLRATNLTGTTDLVLEGYYGAGTGGGGVLYYDAAGGTDDDGLVFQDSVGNPFVRVNPTGDVREWGAKCDAVIVTANGTGGTAGQPNFTAPSAIPTSYIGAPIVVVGAGAAGAPLATTISNIVGTTVTLATNILTAFPTYVASDFVSIGSGGTGYAVGDKYVMSDGTTIIVNVVSSGVVTSLTIFAQAAPQSPKPGLLTQSSSIVGSGTGLTCTLSYTATGQFAYGTDDSTAITNALNSALAGGYDVSIPPGVVCGVGSTITLPAGSVFLRGYDLWSTGLVALAGMSSVVVFPGTDYGGGAERFFVDGMKLATSAIEIQQGHGALFRSVQARNGITQDWYIGDGGIGSADYFEFCDGRTSCKMFGPVGQLSNYNWYVPQSQGCRFISCTADGSALANFRCDAGGAYLLTCNFFGGPCYAYCPNYCFDLNSPTLIAGCQAGSPKIAGYHVAGSLVNMSNNFTQFGLAGYCDPANTYGVLIEAAGSPYFTKDCAVIGSMDDNSITAANLVVQLGTADPSTVVANNPRATYTTAPIVGRSYFQNGAMLVWQEAASYSFTASGQKFLADRWKGYATGASSIAVSRDTGFSGAPYAMKIQRTAGDSHTNSLRVAQQIETAVAQHLQGKTVVVSFDVETGGTDYSGQAYGFDIRIYTGTGVDETFNMSTQAFPTGAVNSSNLRDSTVTVSATPQRVSSKLYQVPSNATEVAVVFTYIPSGTAGTNDWIKITNVQFEAGVTATAFEQQPLSTTYDECRRFYAKTFALATAPAQNVGTATGEYSAAATKAGAVTNLVGTVPFGTSMRVAPAVTTYNPAAANAQVRDETAAADCSAVSVSSITETSCRIGCTGNAATAAGNVLGVHLTADARL